VPPVPLRLSRVRFAATFDPRTLRAEQEFVSVIPLAELGGGRLYAIATVFSPSHLPTALSLRFLHDGKPMRTSRMVELVAHPRGFRIWDLARAGSGGFEPGRYLLEVRTSEGQLVGRARLQIRN
jgi:hypothetical protein